MSGNYVLEYSDPVVVCFRGKPRVLPRSSKVKKKMGWDAWKAQVPPRANLLFICSTIYWEAQPIFYRTFALPSPRDFHDFVSRPGLNTDRNKLIQGLAFGTNCLCIFKNHLREESMPEIAVNKGPPAWGEVFDNWSSYGFGILDHIHFYFQQYAAYFLLQINFRNPLKLYRLIYKLSKSSLTHQSAKEITHTALWTITAVSALAEFVKGGVLGRSFTLGTYGSIGCPA
ncbi:hypothetical protein K469DRAFT_759842 [Zopfia rhizophila CBS 207.26]|uniref:Uncharacterized protein n=1 Tax=Zopfia rhizophila CBS 207.26 TaxID=1314779 RepID=A0A6A6EHT4_9PEZI|nr:hypothetical protein K469DRAFT_759842 [Zopfia rhizophila CBS 207.26]